MHRPVPRGGRSWACTAPTPSCLPTLALRMTRLHKFTLMSAEALRNSPSRADGVPETMEARRRKLAAQHLKQVCSRFKL